MQYQFLIQKDSPLSVEALQLLEEIQFYNSHRFASKIKYYEISIDELVNFQNPGYIPVGSIQFVTRYLIFAYGIDHMTPIEIPAELKCDGFLLRDYNIVSYSNIPRSGRYFVKDVSTLKSFSFTGDTSSLFDNSTEINSQLNQNHIYQVSSVLDILSEYRVIVVDNKIEAIQFYNGDPTIMPSPEEILKIKIMVTKYSLSKNKPDAYAMDVAVVNTNGGRDLALIEIHPAVSIGTYGYACPKLLDMYTKGFEWYIKVNKPQKYMVEVMEGLNNVQKE